MATGGASVFSFSNRFSLTLDWYAHALPENDQKAARIIGVLFKEKPSEQVSVIKFKTA